MPKFTLIIGLKCGELPRGSTSDNIVEKAQLRDKMFINRERIICNDLEKVFLNCGNHNDLYKLGLALIIEGVFNSRGRNMGIHTETLSIVDDLDFFNAYPWGIVCFKLLIKSLLRGWERKADLAKVNDCDKISYTVYRFSLTIQLWVYEAIRELGARLVMTF
ncbi:uncharacterized protein LOC111383787 [Olea europaea var. sylvestris]|uniref:uncharacterized protein LOC111383787 n=1 Tax=Olea europaea var. sylvestris TaxID=158386 RepID=UPI000C1D7BC8|nr:uncharacterized protein LOC111383787 [Olea europaea var. sylvestris]